VDVRLLGPGDHATLEAACRLFGATSDMNVAAFLDGPGTTAVAVVAEDADGVAGWAYGHVLVHPDGERTMLLYALDVAERARGRGVGTALVDAVVGHARAAGCTEVWTLTEADNDAALATYAAAAGQREPDDPVMFSWPLAPRTMS
jgi:GNAT superfamily N-acetyltransferase